MRTYWMIIEFPKGTKKESIEAFGFNILADKNCKGTVVDDNKYYPNGINMELGPRLVFKVPDVAIRKYVQEKYDLVNVRQMRTFTFKENKES